MDYSAYLDSSNDFTKISDNDIIKKLTIDLSILKNECIEFNDVKRSCDMSIQKLTTLYNKKIVNLDNFYLNMKKRLYDEYEDATNKIVKPDSSKYLARQVVLDYVNDFNIYKKETENAMKSFELCSNALKNNQDMNSNFIAELKEEKMKKYIERSYFMKGLFHCLKKNDIEIDVSQNYDFNSILFKEELSYCLPTKVSAYESFSQYDDNMSVPEKSDNTNINVDFSVPIPNSQLLTTEKQTYKTPYYDVNATYPVSIIPDKIDERIVSSRYYDQYAGSSLDSDYRSSSTDQWFIQTALKN